jgi:hypothetical protein
MRAESEKQPAIRTAFAKPDQAVSRSAGFANLAAQHRLECVPLRDLAEKAMVGDRVACGKTGPQSLALQVDRRFGKNRPEIRR